MIASNFEIAHVPDSFAALKGFASESVDVILTDPPYNAHVQRNMQSGSVRDEHAGTFREQHPVKLGFAPLAQYAWAADLVRVARRWAIAFCAVEDFGEFRRAVGADNWTRGGIWYKPNSMGQLTGDRPAAAYEGLAIMHRKTKKQWNGRGSYAHWSADQDDDHYLVCNGTRGEPDRHPNQKPLKLCLELVAKFSNRGETVLDLFCGSGRIGEACLALGRKYIGLDLDPVWVERATARLSNPEVPFGAVSDAACLRLCASPKLSSAAPTGGRGRAA